MPNNVFQLRDESNSIARKRAWKESDLFDYQQRHSGSFAIVGEDALNQNKLEHLILRRNVRAIVDVRLFPAFRPPKFQPQKLIQFLKKHDVSYFDYSVVVRDLEKGRKTDVRHLGVRRLVELKKASLSGMCLILTDEQRTTTVGPILRDFITRMDKDSIEMNPRAFR